jgi:hypothetical protein
VLIELFSAHVSFAREMGLLRSISPLRQLPAAAGHNLIGALVMLKLDDFAARYAFQCATIFDGNEAEPDTVLSRLAGRPLAKRLCANLTNLIRD